MRRVRRLLLLLIAFVLLLGLSILSRFFGGFFGERPVEEGRPPEATEPAEDGPVAGRVLAADGSPAPAGTRVLARGGRSGSPPLAETVTGDGGAFRFDSVPDAAREFEAVAGPLRGRAPADGDAPEIRLPATFDLAGRILEEGAGTAVPEAEVRCGGRAAVSDEAGRFRVEGVPAPGGVLPAVEIVSAAHEPLSVEPGPDAAWDDLFFKLTRKP